MPRVTYVSPDGEPTALDVEEGLSVMQGAIAAGLDGIVAECGGELVCATCHVYVETLAESLPPMGALEDELLEHVVAERRDNSRLSCQLVLGAEHEGLVVALPEAQV
ncbi:(2Fe-2S)-binding protein [Rhodovarius crocodyli]|uniref:(2Fe-2S)-binding protein n=1 Tax=Rhodovarius crocodyli TaxID=1979269 RepID=A0A437MLS8_9PROT|nr:2Fe-2S iron-sulfur cluster-binding protein [Rhodovarius crocodyli]RVT98624.1 (2Fe-2S)-binding protein [Rhodovarius crocodyli]